MTTVALELMGSATAGTSGDYTRVVVAVDAGRSRFRRGRDTWARTAVTLTLSAVQDEVAEGDETIVVEGTATTCRSLRWTIWSVKVAHGHAAGRRRAGRGGDADAAGDRGRQRATEYAVRLTAEPLVGRDGVGERAGVACRCRWSPDGADVHGVENWSDGAGGDGVGGRRRRRGDARRRGADAHGGRWRLRRGDGGAGGP